MTGYEEAQEIVKKIPVNQSNFEHIAKFGQINGSLMSDLCHLLIAEKKEWYNAGLMCQRILDESELSSLKQENERLKKACNYMKASGDDVSEQWKELREHLAEIHNRYRSLMTHKINKKTELLLFSQHDKQS
jgi:hypothetical protein